MKQTKKQIKAEVINEVASQFRKSYEQQINSLSERLKDACDKNTKLQNRLFEIINRNDELEEENAKLKDWCTRLQEWCNLPDGSREAAIKAFEHEQKINDACSGMMEHFAHFFKFIN